MKRLLKAVVAVFFALTFFVSCTEEETPVTVNENPFALNQHSAITFLLQNIQLNADCFNIDYPITLATYTSDYVVGETVEIASDAALMAFLQNLGEGSYAIQYPFNLINSGDVTVEVTGNQSFLDTFALQLAECGACDATNTVFKQAYDSQAGTEEITMDTWTHEYTFSVDTDGTICSIGYQGETDTLEYLIEIVAPDGTSLYSETHAFTSTAIQYISIENPLTVVAGTQYKVRRSIPNDDNGQGIGMLKDVQVPFTTGAITIHQTRFYGGGGDPEFEYNKLPFIDFVFKPAQ